MELMSWRHFLYHLYLKKNHFGRGWLLTKVINQMKDANPLCISCPFSQDHHQTWHRKKNVFGSIFKKINSNLEMVLHGSNCFISTWCNTPDVWFSEIWGVTTFVDHISYYVYVFLMQDFFLRRTI